jgi:DNA-binding response OmpR family regulator
MNGGEKSVKILVVDDEGIIRELMTYVLKKKGFITETARDGKEALDKIALDRPDIVILDIVMPGMDGLEVYKRLRKNPDTEHIPIIFLSAEEPIKHAIAAREKTITEYIEKPCDIEYLLKRIKILTAIKNPLT